MGRLFNGKWEIEVVNPNGDDGEFKRQESTFRNWIKKGDSKYPPEKGRYHLYISLACPWAHRAIIFRRLKNLTEVVGLSVVHPLMKENGWSFETDFEGATGDRLDSKTKFLRDIYLKSDSNCTSRITVPILWDNLKKTIVNNESSEIIRIFNSEFDDLTGNRDDYYPLNHRKEIDEINDYVYENLNNGVYKVGFASTQEAYEKNLKKLFMALDNLEKRLSKNRYLIGNTITEADIRLFTTLIRFDAVYVGHFKCNLRRINDYSNLSRYLKEIYLFKGIEDTVNFNHIKSHYYQSHTNINPSGIVPLGPILALD